MIDLTPLINLLIAVICAVISITVIPWIKAKTTAEQRKAFLAYVDTVVKYCEQMYDTCEGGTKKHAALDIIKKKYGVDFDSDEIETAIEASVLKLHRQLEV